MVSIREKLRQRREARRRDPSGRPTLWRRFRDAGGLGSTLLTAGFYLAVVLFNIWPINPLPYHHEGQYVPTDIYARIGFEVVSPEKLDREKNRIENSTAVYRQSKEAADFLAELAALPDRLQAATQPADAPGLEAWALTPKGLTAWRSLREESNRQRLDAAAQELAAALTRSPVLDSRPEMSAVTVVSPQGTVMVSKEKLLTTADQGETKPLADKLARAFAKNFRSAEAAALRESIGQRLENLLSRPTFDLDPDATNQAIKEALAKLSADPPASVKDAHLPGERIVARGNIRLEQLRLLQAEQAAYVRSQGREEILHSALGRAVTLLMIVGLLAAYVWRYDRELVSNHYLGLATVATLTAALLVTRVTMFSVYSEPAAVLAVVLAVVALNIGRGQRIALMAAFVLSLLAAYQHRAGLGQFIVLLAGSAAATLTLRDIRSRSRLIEVGALSAGVVLVSVWAVAASADLPWDVTFMHAIAAAVAAFAVGFLALGLLPVIERAFRVATSMTLLEWCDASKPLLKRLSMEAPGTFNHSLQLGTMCEAAADAIGARGLLARAGAYYHDIGKTNKSEYFVENQGAMSNPHSKLSPAMSLLIIIGHVKDGLELARQYGLPAVLREFIASHHGTTLVQYFYHAATEQRKSDIDRAPDEVEFRYPGPKPHSREAAILMLADASESSVRAMPEPSPGRIENQVHTVVSRRLMDGQLDECDLTLREVHQIEASLIRSICGIYHSRIAYPRLPSQQRAESRGELPNRNGKNGDGDRPRGDDIARQARDQ